MLNNRRLSDYLPVRFANGDQVRQFSKPCVECGQLLHAQHMQGVARLVKGHIAIAAKAECSACGASFAVTCLIDDGKRVRRVVIPHWLFNPYLRALPAQPGEMLPGAAARAAAQEVAPSPVATPVAQSVVEVQLELAEEAVGRYQGKPIPAWIRIEGETLQFDRVAPGAAPAAGEFLLDGCLVYRKC